ncbi:MurR/RpiR family transcriptional regulator [Candidatus Mycoplasma pogonae]
MKKTIIEQLQVYALQNKNAIYKALSQFFLNNLDRDFTRLKLKDIAAESSCSQGSVSKFVKHLNFNGLKDFLPALAQEITFKNAWTNFEKQKQVVCKNESCYFQELETYHAQNLHNLENFFQTNKSSIVKFVELLKNTKHLILFGKGNNLPLIQIFATYFSKINFFVDYSFDMDVQHQYIAKVTHETLCIFFSFSGNNADINSIFTKVKAKNSQAIIVTLTANAHSLMFKNSDLVFLTHLNEDVLNNHTSYRIVFNYLLMQIINFYQMQQKSFSQTSILE